MRYAISLKRSFCYNDHFAWLPEWALYRVCSVQTVVFMSSHLS